MTAVAMVMSGMTMSAHRSESVTLALKSARLPASRYELAGMAE